MCAISLDIETMPDENVLHLMPEPEVAYGNTKDPEKRKAKEVEAKTKQMDKIALNPLFAKIASVAIVSDDGTEKCFCDEDELVPLVEAVEALRSITGSENRLVTWNGNAFDLPFIAKRAIIRGHSMERVYPIPFLTKKYEQRPHCDVQSVWNGFRGFSETSQSDLNTVSQMILGKTKKDLDYRKIPELIKTEGGRNEIREYNLQDSRLTLEIYHKLKGVFT